MPEDEVARKSLEEISGQILQAIQSLFTATKTVLMYPAENPSVVRMVETAQEAILALMPEGGALDLSYIEEKLVVNGEILDDALQKRGIVNSFHELMKGRHISSVTFWSGLDKDELRRFLAILGTKTPLGSEEEGQIYQLLENEEIRHIEVDEQIYVAISKREKVVDARVAVEREEDAALKALKDEVFARFLAGEVSLGEVGEDTIKAIASDPEKMLSMVQGVISSQGWDASVETLPYRVDETRAILERLSAIIRQVEDPLLRSKLDREVGKITSQIDAPQLTEMLVKSAGPERAAADLPRLLLPMVGDEKLTGVVESVLEEYRLLANRETDDDWPSARAASLVNVLDEARSSAKGEAASRVEQMIVSAGVEITRADQSASIGGLQLGKSLEAGGGMELCDLAKGPALVGAARYLFEKGEDELGAEVVSRVGDRFRKQSPEAKTTAAQQIWGLFRLMRDLGKEAYTADLVDEVSEVLDEGRAAARTLSGLTETMEQVAVEDSAAQLLEGAGIGLDTAGPLTGKTLERLMASDTAKVVQAVFREGDKSAMEAISRVLLGMEDKALPALLDTAQGAADEKVLQSSADSLRSLKVDPMPQIAARFSQELPPNELVNLIKLAGMVGDENSASVFNPLLVNEDPEVRTAILQALGQIGGKQAMQMVITESANLDPLIKAAAVRELGSFRDYLAVRRLLEVVTPGKKGELLEDTTVLMAACHSLGDLRVRQAVEVLSEVAQGGRRGQNYPEELRATAASALGKIGGDEAQKVLRKLLKDSSMLVRSTARKTLGSG